MSTAELISVDFEASDLSGQKTLPITRIPEDARIGELIDSLLPKMSLPNDDAEGRPLTYHALLEREGRHLHASERVLDVIETKDRIVLEPNIDAGAPRC